MLTAIVHAAEMGLTSKQHLQLAVAYEKAATDWLVPPEQQAALARKAHWLRVLAQLADKDEQAANQLSPKLSEAN